MIEIFQGVLVGVGAGAALSAISAFEKWMSRRAQIAFIREFLISRFAKLKSRQDPIPLIEDETDAPADQYRAIFLSGFMRELQAIADHRTESMKNAQVCDLQKALYYANYVIGRFSKSHHYPQGWNWYQRLYELFAGFDWLGMPKNPPWESPSS